MADGFNRSLSKQYDSSSPNRQTNIVDPDNSAANLEARKGSNPYVNEIIVKIEMKKFQNLIENRIKHKNNLLQADMKRVYPLTKKTQDCGETLYDQFKREQASPKRKKYANLNGNKLNSSVNLDTSQMQQQNQQSKMQTGYGTDDAYASGEEVIALGDNTTISEAPAQNSNINNISVFKKTSGGNTAETSQAFNNTSIHGRLLNSQEARDTNEISQQQTDRGYEQSMPQSQLWFVNNRG